MWSRVLPRRLLAGVLASEAEGTAKPQGRCLLCYFDAFPFAHLRLHGGRRKASKLSTLAAWAGRTLQHAKSAPSRCQTRCGSSFCRLQSLSSTSASCAPPLLAQTSASSSSPLLLLPRFPHTTYTHSCATYSLRKRWCPNAGCPNLVMYPRGDTRDVTCKCGHSFCFQCLAEAHTPTDCSIVRKYGVGAVPGTAASRAELTPLSLCSHLPPQMAVEGNPRGRQCAVDQGQHQALPSLQAQH